MRRIAILVAVAAAASAGLATAPAASACTGLVCDEICHWWTSSTAQDVFSSPAVKKVLTVSEGCPIR